MDDDARAYFQAVEQHFIQARGQPLILSPDDVRRVTRWHEDGVPIEAILEGIDVHFDRMRRRGRAPRRAVTLAYVEDDVVDAWTGVKQRRLGKATAGAVRDAPPAGGPDDLERFLSALRRAEARLVASSSTADAAIAGALGAAARRLEGKAALFDPARPEHDPQRVEDHLRRLERSLVKAAREALGEEALAALESRVDADLAGKRERMKDSAFERVRDRLVEKALREAHGIPRLSLFYT